MWHYRHGAPVPLVKRIHEPDIRKGRAHVVEAKPCGRCGGAGGADKWKYTGWTCYGCGGERYIGWAKVPVYTMERIEKMDIALNKRRERIAAKRHEDRLRELAAAEERRATFMAANETLLGDMAELREHSKFLDSLYRQAMETCKLTEPQYGAAIKAIIETRERLDRKALEQAKRDASEHFGEVGERMEIVGEVERNITIRNRHWGDFDLVTIRDPLGNAILYRGNALWRAEQGDQIEFRAKIKEHSEYRGEKQTQVSNPTKIQITKPEPERATA